MVLATVSVHKRGLHPMEAVKAWHPHSHGDMSLDAILKTGEVLNTAMQEPSRKALRSAIQRVSDMGAGDLAPQPRYGNCGRKRALTDGEVDRAIGFVKVLAEQALLHLQLHQA